MIQIYVVAGFTVINNQWTYITATYEGSESKEGLNIYINEGNKTKSRHESGSYSGMFEIDQQVEIGRRRNTNTDTFDGKIDNVRIYDEELTPTEVTNIDKGNISTMTANTSTEEKLINITPSFKPSALIWIMSLIILWKKQKECSKKKKDQFDIIV